MNLTTFEKIVEPDPDNMMGLCLIMKSRRPLFIFWSENDAIYNGKNYSTTKIYKPPIP